MIPADFDPVNRDFQGEGRLSFATISYYVANYYKAPNPQIRMYYNDFVETKAAGQQSQLKTSYWNDEALLYLPKPDPSTRHEVVPLAEVARWLIELELIPPQGPGRQSNSSSAVKVLFGDVHVEHEQKPRSALAVPAYTSASAILPTGTYKAGPQGSVLLRFTRTVSEERSWPQVENIPVKLLHKVSPRNGPQPTFAFTRVQQSSTPNCKEKDFWNLKGFEIRLLDQTPLAHLQFWAAGKKHYKTQSVRVYA